MANVVDATLANCGVFMQLHTPNVEAASIWYMKANGIPSPSCSDIDSP